MKQKLFILIGIIILFTINPITEMYAQKIKTVVIDPGHGGKDPGAVGKISKEKDIVLPVSLDFGKQIEKNFKDIKVIYTRTDDSHVELYKRAEIANKNKADMFISIHVNSVDGNTKAYGTETFVMGSSKNAANLQVAKLENSAILKETNYEANYDGFDPNDPENHIIFSLYQNANLVQSLLFAQYMQEGFKNSLKRYDRGVKQAGFLVLWKTAMPSALVELGFISNAEEEQYLNSEKGQKDLSTALFQAFVKYKEQYEGEVSNIVFEFDERKEITESSKKENKLLTNDVIASDEKNKLEKGKSEKEINEDKVVYKIQIHTSPKKIELIPENFKSYKTVDVYLHNGVYKYTIGEDTDYDQILELYKEVKKDFKDSFIVSFKNGQRI